MEAGEACLSNESTLTKINTFFEDACKSSCEGIMAKTLDVDAGYCASKRTDAWLKVLLHPFRYNTMVLHDEGFYILDDGH